ncbi:hypothetical protein EDD16DRAFT_1541344 [Pisolithus croceorrhizus]|nr:hypothetical protein EDD16DRAFT_1541344 [Pisolithus croceorrhizus]KAI6135108.1 hypothetical protein EV401DRAFT_1902673 [Pisolithus croceorrhizus]KAI6163191.1 hypothetical protein EDD17DRAFT_517971 [Pisolithus thermaeus]
MLAGSVSHSPRPRPPARSRRIVAKSSPPPPYRASSPSEEGISRNEGFASDSRSTGWDRLVLSAQSEQWDHRSRGELSDLLLKADELIRDREQELNATSAACKTLFEHNLGLKNRHRALLARLPVSPTASMSPRKPLLPSPTLSDAQLPQSPHYYSDTSRSSSRASFRASLPRHRRQISMSPSDLEILSAENAQLLAKLEKLEAESIQADQAGRKKLRVLEREIQGLREELERTRAKSDELEAKARAASAQRDEESSKRRREREERVRTLRGKSAHESDDVCNFAPSNPLGLGRHSKPRLVPRRHLSEAVLRPLCSEADTVSSLSRKLSLRGVDSHSASHSNIFGLSDIQSDLEAPTEYALVSQLLSKIKELEETNAQIIEQQAKTTAQLQSVQKDADSIRLAYESLSDAESVQWISEGEECDERSEPEETDDTVRFSSLRRSLSMGSPIGINHEVEPNLPTATAPVSDPNDTNQGVLNTRARKSVVGLFDSSTPAGSPSTPIHHDTPSVHTLTIPGLPPVPFVPQPSRTSSRSPSPIRIDSLSGTVSPAHVDVPNHPTLDCELGAALHDNWDNNQGSHRFKTPSLVDFGTFDSQCLTPDCLGSLSVISMSSDIPSAEPELVQKPPETFTSAVQSSHGGTRLRPSTWRGYQTKSETATERKRRQLETIRMRTYHWNQSRFEGTLLHPGSRHSGGISPPSTPVPERLASAFDAVVGTIGRSSSLRSSTSAELSPDEAPRAKAEKLVRPRTAAQSPQRAQQRGIVAFVLEVWLWLQFIIIIVVFVWAMAKRGPKSVLEGASRKNRG